MKRTLMIVLPLLTLIIGGLAAVAMYSARPEAQTRVPEPSLPLVRFETVTTRPVRMTVLSQGTVMPRTMSTLVPEVAGKIVEVSDSWETGGFFEENELLIRIDAHDYEQAVIRAEAMVSQAELRLARERAEADVARREWSELGQGEATPLTLREPQMADAQASMSAAQAGLDQARRNLDRTDIRAPYVGRVRTKNVDVGQYVIPGTPVGDVYAVDFAEIRLPLPDRDLAYLDLPLVYRGQESRGPGSPVTLRAEFAGSVHEWQGRIVRTEGEIDPRTRMVNTVAQVRDPYARGDDPDRPPLAAGLFVEAEIHGRMIENAVVIPRAAVRGDDTVLVLDDDDRLRFRTVDILRRTHGEAIVAAGLEEGERVCVSPIIAVTDGMQVRTEGS